MARSQAAVLSAASLILIAGCSGGRSTSSLPPQPLSSANAAALANTARAKLTIAVPQGATQSGRRKQQVSPFTQYVGLWQTSGGTTVFSTSIPLSGCYNVGTYICYANLAIGSYPVYGALYDSTNHMLSTTGFTHPSATTIYPNGSYYSNNVSIAPYPVVSKINVRSPLNCDVNRGTSTFTIDVFDADNIAITGDVANPFSFTTSAVAGNSANLYVGDPGHNTTIANGQLITSIGSGVYQNQPALRSTGGDAAVGISVQSSYGPIPTLRVANQNFPSGATANFAIGTEMLWRPSGSSATATALLFPAGYANTSFGCGTAPITSPFPGAVATNVITGTAASGPDAYVFIGESTNPGVIAFSTEPANWTTNGNGGNPALDPTTYFAGGEAHVGGGGGGGTVNAMTFDEGVQQLFVASSNGNINIFPSPSTGGFATIDAGASYFTGTPTHLAVLHNYPTGHDQIAVLNGTSSVFLIDYDFGAHTFASTTGSVGAPYVASADSAHNSGSTYSYFFRVMNGGQGFLMAVDATNGTPFVNTTPLGSTASGGAFFKARSGGLSGFLLAADGNSITGFPYANAASTVVGYALAPIYTFAGAVTNFISSTGPSYLGVNVSGTLNVISNAASPSLYLSVTGFAGPGLLTGN